MCAVLRPFCGGRRGLAAPVGLCLLLGLANEAQALDPSKRLTQYMREAWTTANGLPQNAAFSILQTRDGYLWFGTLEGLVRFDGLEFTVFDPSNTPRLPYPNVAALYEDQEGMLWVATGGSYSPRPRGNVLLRYLDGKFQSFTESDGYPGYAAHAIRGARDGGLWIGMGHGLCRFKEGVFHLYSTKDGLSGNNILSICEDREGTLWIATDHGVNRYKDGRFYAFEPNSPLARWQAKAIREAADGSIWVGTRGGLVRFKDGQATHYTMKDGMPENEVMTVYEDRDRNLWVGTEHGYLLRWRDGKFSASLNLADDPIWSIYESREGSLWVGSFTGGLHRLKDGKFTAYTTVEGLLSDSTWGVFEDSEGNIWVSTSKGLNRISNGKITSYTSKDGLLETGASKVYQDRQGRLWIGTTAGLNCFKDGHLVGYRFPKGEEGFVTAIHEDAAGTLWVGSVRGLFKFQEGKLTLYLNRNEAHGAFVNAIYEAPDGAFWLGTNNGLYRFEHEQLTAYPTPDASSADVISSIVPDDEGGLWLGTDRNGLLRFRDGQFVRCTTRDGLFNNSITTILDDGLGRFWIGCNKGVFSVSKQALRDFADGKIAAIISTAYDTADGLKNRETTDPSTGWKSRDGRLWFSTVQGVAVIDPARLQLNTIVPPVYIRQSLADGRAASLDDLIQIAPGTRSVEFQYTGLSLLAPESVRYRYRLEGFDRDWVEAGSRRAAYYTNLPAGQYTFRVIAANNDGLWNMEGASLRVVVNAPFWRRAWFWLAVGVIVVGIIAFIYRARIAQLKKRQAAQEAFSRQLIASQEQERKRLAVELHDSLGQSLVIIKNRALMSLNKPEDHERALTQIEEISEAASGALQEIREIAASLHPYQLDRFGLVNALEEMIARLAASSPIQVSRDIDPIDGELSKEAQINLYRIVQESLNNIVKHAEASAVRVSLKREANVLRLLIEDNGKGFQAEAIAGKKTGLGLTGIAERARVLGGKSEIHSTPGQGTSVRLEMQLGESANER